MTTALTRTNDNQLPMTSTDDVFRLAKAFAQSGVLGARNDAEGVMALKVVQEVGIVAANERYNIMMGKLSKKAHAIAADFIRAGGSYRIVRRDSECAELVASFGDTRNMTFSFSWDDAQHEPFVYAGGPDQQRAELAKPVAQRRLKDKYSTPRSRMQMLWARVISDMGQALCPQACEGLYPPEVVADFDDRPPARTAQIIDVPAEDVAARVAAQSDTMPSAPVDYTICPDGFGDYSGAPWSQMPTDILEAAARCDMDALTATHRAAIRHEIEQRSPAPSHKNA